MAGRTARSRVIRTPGGFRKQTSRSPKDGRVLGRHRALLDDPLVRPWWEARSLRSRLAADQALRQLGFLLERAGLTPEEALKASRERPESLRDLLVKDAAQHKAVAVQLSDQHPGIVAIG